MVLCWTAVSPRLTPEPQQHPGAVCPSLLLRAVAALYLPRVSSLVQKRGMLMCPYSGKPCASRHDMGVSKGETAGEDSHPVPVEIFRSIFNCPLTLTLLLLRDFCWHFLSHKIFKFGTCCGMDNASILLQTVEKLKFLRISVTNQNYIKKILRED